MGNLKKHEWLINTGSLNFTSALCELQICAALLVNLGLGFHELHCSTDSMLGLVSTRWRLEEHLLFLPMLSWFCFLDSFLSETTSLHTSEVPLASP